MWSILESKPFKECRIPPTLFIMCLNILKVYSTNIMSGKFVISAFDSKAWSTVTSANNTVSEIFFHGIQRNAKSTDLLKVQKWAPRSLYKLQ